MDIKCGHCGGRHESVAKVKACSGQAGPRVDSPIDAANRLANTLARATSQPARVAKVELATVGMYRKGGQIYRVDWTAKGYLFAKVATVHRDEGGQTRVSYSGAKGMVAKLSQADRMDVDEVAEFGKLTSTCLRCGRFLEEESSVLAGIGPICRTRV
jgi:hypothetical protein